MQDFRFSAIGVVLAVRVERAVEPVQREQLCRDARVFSKNGVGMLQHMKRT
jgi:hypothetical protein